MNTTQIHWYDNQVELLNFAKYLHDEDEFLEVDDVLYFFEKPWKWNEEYLQYKKEVKN